MNPLSNVELMSVQGGGTLKWIAGGLIVAFVFVASVVYGYIHPNKC